MTFNCSFTMQIERRKHPIVIIPTPALKASIYDRTWCYQMLMLFTPFRRHEDVMVHPFFRNLSRNTLQPDEIIEAPTCAPDASAPAEVLPQILRAHSPILSNSEHSGEDDDTALVRSFLDAERLSDSGRSDSISSSSSSDEHDEEDSFVDDDDHEGRYVEEESDSDLRDPLPAPTPRAGRYEDACELFAAVVGRVAEGWWPSKYTHLHEILDALQGVAMDEFAARQTVPTEADMLAHFRAIGLDNQENSTAIQEMIHQFRLQTEMTAVCTVRNDPTKGFFVGSRYEADLAKVDKVRRDAFRDALGAPRERSLLDDARQMLTVTIQIDQLNEERSAILQSLGCYSTMKLRQKAVLLTVLGALEDYLKYENCLLAPNEERRTCRLLLQGEAGTGKSFVLHKVIELCCKYLGRRSVNVCAPTANAVKAYESCGCVATTFHRIFHKNVRETTGAGVQHSLQQEDNESWRVQMRTVRAIIVDEMSMLSPSDIHLMNMRFRDAYYDRKSVSLPTKYQEVIAQGQEYAYFNNMPIVILAGDLYQLPPVRASPLYSEPKNEEEVAARKKRRSKAPAEATDGQELSAPSVRVHNEGLEIYHTFFDKAIVLNENVRQEGAENASWRQILGRVRVGRATLEDARKLQLCTLADSDLDPHNPLCYQWMTCPRFMPQVEKVLRESDNVCRYLFPNPSDIFNASPQVLINGKEAEAAEVKRFGSDIYKKAHPLCIASGAKVMVTENLPLARDWGIVNGSTGSVVGYVSTNKKSITHVLVRLDSVLPDMPPLLLKGENGEQISMPETWAFKRKKLAKTCTLSSKNGGGVVKYEVKVMFFPLNLAYAMTIHKAQGQTSERAIIDIRGCFDGQQPYVALSRVRNLDGLRLLNPPKLSDLNMFAVCPRKPLLEAEMTRICNLQKTMISDVGLVDENYDS